MPWLLMFAGAVMGYAFGNTVMYFLLGAITGYLAGICFEFNDIKNNNKRLEAQIEKLQEDLSYYQKNIDQQLNHIRSQKINSSLGNHHVTDEQDVTLQSSKISQAVYGAVSETPQVVLDLPLDNINLNNALSSSSLESGFVEPVLSEYKDAYYVKEGHMDSVVTDSILADIHNELQKQIDQQISSTSHALNNKVIPQAPVSMVENQADLSEFISQNTVATLEETEKVEPRVLNPDITLHSPNQANKSNQNARQSRTTAKEDNDEDLSLESIYRWFFGGNTILKVGVIILFLGLAFLLRYATADMVVPIEMRYLGVVMSSAALVWLGWRLRYRENNYGLILQGAGVGLLYLSCYAAMSMHALLSPGTAFFLLIVVAAFAVTLAIWQDSLSLAVVATIGGFAAPILASTGSGNHIALFSYFMVLNIAIMSIAWHKAWRLLNLAGFMGTFGIGMTWGNQSFTPDVYVSTQLFLLAFFVLYFIVGVLFTKQKLLEAGKAPKERQALLQWSFNHTDYIDSTVVLGLPIVAFGLQYAIIKHIENGVAVSALLLGMFYALVATWLFRQDDKRTLLLAEINAGLAVLFLTLSIPLYFEAQWTSASWALEAAGLYWIGLKQQRKFARYLAVALQLFSCVAWLWDVGSANDTVLLTGSGLGAALIGLSLLFTAWGINQNQSVILVEESYWSVACQWLGLSLLYVVPCFYGLQQQTALIWVVGSVLALGVAKFYGQTIVLYHGLIMQFLATVFYFSVVSFAQIGTGEVNWSIFNMLMIFGILFLFSTALYQDELQTSWQDNPIYCNVILALSLIAFAPLFVLHMSWVILIWALMGLLVLRLAAKWQLPIVYGFAVCLEAIAMICFYQWYTQDGLDKLNWPATLCLPLVLSLVGFINAWCIHCHSSSLSFEQKLSRFSHVLLLCSSVFWCVMVFELVALMNPSNSHVYYLYAITGSLLLTATVARASHWPALAYLAAAVVPISAVIFVISHFDVHGMIMRFAWLTIGITHLLVLKILDDTLIKRYLAHYHLIGILFLTVVGSTGLFDAMQTLSTHQQTWLWLSWIILPNLYMGLMAMDIDLPWPISAFSKTYRQRATLLLAVALLCWYWVANWVLDGQNGLMPYLPIFNPLELGLLLTLANAMFYGYRYWEDLPVRANLHAFLGVSLFAFVTAAVFRASYHYADVPFEIKIQMQSMVVQASLSILWTIIALALMIIGHKHRGRSLWLVGAGLIAVVVVKLFFVELSNSGGIERIASFIVVGILLLIVGYFAPLPPKEGIEK